MRLFCLFPIPPSMPHCIGKLVQRQVADDGDLTRQRTGYHHGILQKLPGKAAVSNTNRANNTVLFLRHIRLPIATERPGRPHHNLYLIWIASMYSHFKHPMSPLCSSQENTGSLPSRQRWIGWFGPLSPTLRASA